MAARRDRQQYRAQRTSRQPEADASRRTARSQRGSKGYKEARQAQQSAHGSRPSQAQSPTRARGHRNLFIPQVEDAQNASSGASSSARLQRGQVPTDSTQSRQQAGKGSRSAGRQQVNRQAQQTRQSPRQAQARQTRDAQQASRTRRAQQSQPSRQGDEANMTSTSVDELRRADRRALGAKKAQNTTRRRLAIFAAAIFVVVAAVIGSVVLYNSPAFSVEEVNVIGVEHLTSDEMSQLANVPADATLLRVDTDTIVSRLKQSAWVKDVQIERVFPNTLQINVTERAVAAIVEIPTNSTKAVKKWAIADDYIWLMPIPDADSDAAKSTSAQIYEDDKNVLHIVDLPYGTKAEIGEVCTDEIVNNALGILAGMTTELADQVVEISAASTAETTLILDDGVEIAFGKAEDIRDKERLVLKILEENPDNISYINVRMVETPTWRAI